MNWVEGVDQQVKPFYPPERASLSFFLYFFLLSLLLSFLVKNIGALQRAFSTCYSPWPCASLGMWFVYMPLDPVTLYSNVSLAGSCVPCLFSSSVEARSPSVGLRLLSHFLFTWLLGSMFVTWSFALFLEKAMFIGWEFPHAVSEN